MKYGIPFLVFLILLFFAKLPLLYASITQGHANAHIEIHNDISGNGSVSTHIESTVNGKTQTYDSTKPGDVTIDNNGEKTTVTTSTQSVSNTPTPSEKRITKQQIPLVSEISKFLKNILQSIFHISAPA